MAMNELQYYLESGLLATSQQRQSRFSSYIIGGWEDGQMSDETAQGLVDQFNSLNNGYTLTPSNTGKNLKITISYTENNKQYNRTVTKGIVERKK